MQILYKPILNVQLWHDYVFQMDEMDDLDPSEEIFNGQPEMPLKLTADYGISDILILRPTKTCEKTLKNLRWVARSHAQGLTLFAEVEAIKSSDPNTDYRTKIPVDRPTRLAFYLKVNDPYFANFTNLPLVAANNQQIYYFSNISGSAQSYDRETDTGSTETVEYLFLSQPLPAYDATAEYFIGSLVTDGDNTFESLTYQSTTADLDDTEVWMSLPRSEYVSSQDQLPRQPLNRLQTIASASPNSNLSLSLIDINGQRSFGQTVEVPDTHPPGEPFTFGLNFAGQAPGRYQLVINDTLKVDEFVLFDPFAAPKVFAFVELAITSSNVPPAFALTQAEGEQTLIQQRTYIIRFKNRTTLWRYRTQLPHKLTADDLGPSLELVNDRTFVTSQPRGLLQKPNPPILKAPNTPPLRGQRYLPFPSSAQIKTDDNRPVTQVFSDIYL